MREKGFTEWGYTIGDFAEKLQLELKPELETELDAKEFQIKADLNHLIRAMEDFSSNLRDL